MEEKKMNKPAVSQAEDSPMHSWAEREVELAKLAEGDTWTAYAKGCYDSALKAFKSLLSDGHSGCSISVTASILNNLIKGKPLTPLNDVPEDWFEVSQDEVITYQNRRCSSLFKRINTKTGQVSFSENHRFVCFDKAEGVTFTSGLVNRVLSVLEPITFPFVQQTYKVCIEELLTDPANGDFDTVAIRYYTKGSEMVAVNRFFKECPDDVETPVKGWLETTEEEYQARQQIHERRISDNQIKHTQQSREGV
jgi:hypothetical protein